MGGHGDTPGAVIPPRDTLWGRETEAGMGVAKPTPVGFLGQETLF